MSNELAIIRKENIDIIVSNAPAAYNENTVSHDRCLDAGRKLLAQMQQGMTDELDQQAAVFIEKARKTVHKMNDKRSSLTKLFDEIRSTFTGMENDIDPTKANTVPYLIQLERNRYAAKKREEEQRRQREAMLRQQAEQARAKYRTDCDNDYRNSFRGHLDFYIDGLRGLFQDVTLDNYDQRLADIQNASISFPADYAQIVRSTAPLPMSGMVSADELQQIRTASLSALLPTFIKEFELSMQSEKQRILQLMPSKRQELERAAKASAEEAERIRQQMAEREKAETARLEQERAAREQQQRMEADMKQKKAEIGGLFDQASVATPTYQPKTSVKKKLVPLNVEAFPEIISLWWTKEGCRLSIDELSKMFKKQITFCEKCAKEGELIQSEHICYEDEVKAK